MEVDDTGKEYLQLVPRELPGEAQASPPQSPLLCSLLSGLHFSSFPNHGKTPNPKA